MESTDHKVPHVFRVTLGVDLRGEQWVTLRSLDGEIHTRLPAAPDITGMFPCGVHQLLCHGYWDTQTNLVMLGKIIDDDPLQPVGR